MRKIELLEIEELKTKQTQELKDIGIFDVYELVINPWKVYYKIGIFGSFAKGEKSTAPPQAAGY